MAEQIYEQGTLELVTVAASVSDFLEDALSLDKRTFMDRAIKLLTTLYLKTALLPNLKNEEEEEELLEDFVSEYDYNQILASTSRVLGSSDRYLNVLTDYETISDTANASDISENLADIYQDLKNFLLRYQIGNESVMTQALKELQNNFRTYWGQRLLDALKALHAAFYSPNTDFEEQPLSEEDWENAHEKEDETEDEHTHHCDDPECDGHHHQHHCNDHECHCHHD